MKKKIPICDYCKKTSNLVTGEVIYPHRPDLYSLNFYICKPCNAYVGCHKGTINPLGRLANTELRNAKKEAHAAFDPIWKARHERKSAVDPTYKKSMARGGRYKKLAELLGVEIKDCHIGMFDVDMCMKVIQICNDGLLSEGYK